jgi:hypothetical protein
MRKHGIESLEIEKAGISVFMTEEEEEKEPDFKTPMAFRPVDREFNSQMKAYEQLMEGIPTQVLEDKF